MQQADVFILFIFLTRKPAVVVAITVVSVKLRGNGSGVTHQQEDEGQSSRFQPRETFAPGHLQRIDHISQLNVKKNKREKRTYI